MRSGSVIGIPLTLLQLGVHHTHLGLVDPWLIANNFVVANAIYDADRINASFFAPERSVTRLSMIASASFYASEPSTFSLVPVVLGLHLFYTSIKATIAPVKPFFVAFFWTLAIYYVPLLRGNVPIFYDNTFAASFFLSIAALSHVADVVDIDEDVANGILTTAVLLGEKNSKVYAISLGLVSAFLHSASKQPFVVYDFTILSILVGIVYDQVKLSVLAAIFFCLLYAHEHDVEVLSFILQSSEGVHKIAISLSTTTIENAFRISEPWRSCVVKSILSLAERGDAIGHDILELYKQAIFDRL